MASIKDIAKETGVSIGTVDRVIHDRGRVSDETREKILSAMEKLNYKPNHVAQGLAINKKKLNLCFLIINEERNPFYFDVKKAAVKRAEKLKQYGVTVNICTLEVADIDDAQLTEKIKKATENMDGIVTLGFQGVLAKKQYDELYQKRIPVVFYNCLVPDVDYLAFVGCNYTDSGRLAAGVAAQIGGNDAKVGVFSQALGRMQSQSYSDRMLGFRQEMQQRYPDMKIVTTQSIELDAQLNRQAVEQALKEHPDMNIAYIVNPADYQICEEIYKADKDHKIKIITNDLVGRQIEMVKNGIISVTICQEPEKQGDKPLDILFQYLAYGVKPKNKHIYTKLSIHIAQNAL